MTSLEKSASKQHIYQTTEVGIPSAHMDRIIQQHRCIIQLCKSQRCIRVSEHRIPDHDLNAYDAQTNSDIDKQAIQLALARPSAELILPPRTGLDWTDEVSDAARIFLPIVVKQDWERNAMLKADYYIREQQLSYAFFSYAFSAAATIFRPIPSPRPPPPPIEVNGHLRNRATYNISFGFCLLT